MKKKKTKVIKGIVAGLISATVIALIGVSLSIKGSIDQAFDSKIEPTKINKVKDKTNNYAMNFLIVGVDNTKQRQQEEGLEGTRADSIMIASLNTKKGNVSLYNIPRDTTTPLYDGNNHLYSTSEKPVSKINEAYEHGEEAALKNTVEHLFPGIAIDYYVTFNFDSFKKIIDSLGGININVEEDILNYDQTKILITKGNQKLNGKQALDYARARSQDDDIHRGYRQQEVVKAIIKKAEEEKLSIGSVLGVINSLNGSVNTNFDMNEVMDLYKSIQQKPLSFSQIPSYWEGYDYNGASMVMLTKSTRKLAVNTLNKNINRTNNSVEFISNGLDPVQSGLNKLEDYHNQGYSIIGDDMMNEIFSELYSSDNQ